MLTVSSDHPVGHINRWPPGDAVAWQRLVAHAERAIDLFDLMPIEAYHDAALALGLDGDEYHWLVDDALAHVHGLFYLSGWDFYVRAPNWLKAADGPNFAKKWLVEEALRRVKSASEMTPK